MSINTPQTKIYPGGVLATSVGPKTLNRSTCGLFGIFVKMNMCDHELSVVVIDVTMFSTDHTEVQDGSFTDFLKNGMDWNSWSVCRDAITKG